MWKLKIHFPKGHINWERSPNKTFLISLVREAITNFGQVSYSLLKERA